jgi:hypothetical protein
VAAHHCGNVSSVRDRLREGFLLRLARTRDADAFALRGGMLVHHWIPDAHRPVGDIDLVCALPFRPRDLRQRLFEVLAHDLPDGVTFDAERFRIDRIAIGLELFAAGEVDGSPFEIAVDLAFGIDVWPATVRRPLLAERGTAPIFTCAPEMVIATKLAVTAELGVHGWRPKDVADLWLAIRRFPPSSMTRLGGAFERRVGSPHEAIAVLDASWWCEPRAAMRWARFVARRPFVPRDLEVVLAELRDALAPLARTS